MAGIRQDFQQHAALNLSIQWSKLNPRLHASPTLSCRSGPSQGCGLCHEADHAYGNCAMRALFPQSAVLTVAPGRPLVPIRQLPTGGSINHTSRLETLERVCMSWKGRGAHSPSATLGTSVPHAKRGATRPRSATRHHLSHRTSSHHPRGQPVLYMTPQTSDSLSASLHPCPDRLHV